MKSGESMSFLAHLEELRKRLIRSIVAILCGMVVCWFFREELMAFLLNPLYEAWSGVAGLPEPKPLNFTGLLEPFVAYLKLSAIGGLFLAIPVVLYQFWKFIAPGLYPKERRYAYPFVLVSSLLFVGGSVMAYQVVFPIGFRFFLEFAAGVDADTYTAVVEMVSSDEESDPSARKNEEVEKNAPTKGKKGEIAPNPAPKTEKSVIKPEKNAGGESWYEWLWGRLIAEECGALQTRRVGADVELTFDWAQSRCGKMPEIDRTLRDETQADLVWSPVDDAPAGSLRHRAVDSAPGTGPIQYDVVVPVSSGQHRLVPVLMVRDYLAFAIRLLLAFGLIFELPILITFLSLAGIVNYRQLLSFSRWFAVIAVALAAMLTPPDVVTQVLLALPLILLYFFSVLVAFIFGPRPEPEEND